MMGAILAYFGSKVHLLLMGADLNAQFKIVYADGSKLSDNTETNISDLRSASENDVSSDLKVRETLTFIFFLITTTPLILPFSSSHSLDP